MKLVAHVLEHGIQEGPAELDLLRRISRGDQAAFTTVYRQWKSPIYRFAWHMTASVPLAEEVMQDTFLALMDKPGRFDPAKGSLGSYLFGIARNIVSKRIRTDSSRDTSDLAHEDGEIAAGGLDPWAALSHQELVETVRTAVVSLPLPYREAVALCDLEELSYEAAARALDCPVGTVRSRLSRGRLLLAMKLKEFARVNV
ncbi:MAG TPA: sigma-70 family RNA polymerase sigma factor [Bryobacteraceae bacterium]